MSGLVLALLVLLAAPVAGQEEQACVGETPAHEGAGPAPFVRADVRELASVLTCYCGCPHLQVSQCFCGTADKIRADLARRLDSGEAPEAIIAAYVAEHGAGVLAVPPRRGFHWIIWLGPPALLIAGAVGVFLVGRRWSRRRTPEAAPGPLAPEDEARYREALRQRVEGQT